MITPMKKVTILTLASHKEETLKALREMEIIHLTPLQNAAGASVNGAKGAVARVQKAMEVVPDKLRKGVTPAEKGASGVTLVEEIQTLLDLLQDAVLQIEGRLIGEIVHRGRKAGKHAVGLHAIGAGFEVCFQGLTLCLGQFAVDHGADLLLKIETVRHCFTPPFIFFDAYVSGRFPSRCRNSQSFFRARNRRDLTVPSSSCSCSPISA